MKINWKVLVGLVLIFGALVWAVDSLRSRSYAGTTLDFSVGQGRLTVTNPSGEPVLAQLVGSGARSFSVVSVADGSLGSSTREGTGRTSTQTFDLTLPPGVSEFTVVNGSGVTLNATANTRLEAVVEPASASTAQATLIATAVVILGSLFFISYTIGHRWLPSSRRHHAAQLVARQSADLAMEAHSQGRAMQSYGDNRISTPD